MRTALRIVLVYAVVAGVWIWASDLLSRGLTVDPNMLTLVAIAKGTLFVVVTSALLFLQIRDDLAHLQSSADEVRASEQRCRRIIDVSPVPMTMNDADGNVTLTNEAFVRSLGYTKDDIPTVSEWWPKAYPEPEYRRRMMDAWDREIAQSQQPGDAFSPLEARIRSKDGTERSMLLSTAPLGTDSTEQVAVFFDTPIARLLKMRSSRATSVSSRCSRALPL